MREKMKQKCEEIIINQYLKGNINNEYKNAALLELEGNEKEMLIALLEKALESNYLEEQLKLLQNIYYVHKHETLKTENEALKKELREIENALFE
jgi:hypothetical protein